MCQETEVPVDTCGHFCYILGVSEERINIYASDKKFRVGVFSPSEWAAGMRKPSMAIELFPIFHKSSVTFSTQVVEAPDVMDGWDSQYIADKVAVGIKAELEAEGEISNEERSKDHSWILTPTDGYIRPGTEYKAMVWFVSERTGEISAVWVASAEAVKRKDATIQEPKGHRYKV